MGSIMELLFGLFSQKCSFVYEVGVSSSRTDGSAVISVGLGPERLHSAFVVVLSG